MSTTTNSAKAFFPGQLWLDNQQQHINAHGGGILFHQGTYYWFGEHKIAGEAGNKAHVGVHCYSSTDLYNWTDAGITLAISDDPASEITKGCVIERPKVIYNAQSRQFVMWFHLELKDQGYNAARSGIAVADQVTGPYRYVRSMRLDAGVWPMNVAEELKKPLMAQEADELAQMKFHGGPEGGYPADKIFRRDFVPGQMARDMTLFVDDDGKAYHIAASEDNGVLHISQLTDDYQNCAGKYVRVFPGRFHEAPAIFKHQGKYYLLSSGCTGWAPNAARGSVADSIWGPWKEFGNPCQGVNPQNGHGPELTFGGQSTYILPVAGLKDAYIAMFDIWCPKNAIDGRYVWLPVQVGDGTFTITWKDHWDLSCFRGNK